MNLCSAAWFVHIKGIQLVPTMRRKKKWTRLMEMDGKKFNLYLMSLLRVLLHDPRYVVFIHTYSWLRSSNEYRWTLAKKKGYRNILMARRLYMYTLAINTNLHFSFDSDLLTSIVCARPVRTILGKRLVKYNFMDDCKYWSPLDASQHAKSS